MPRAPVGHAVYSGQWWVFTPALTVRVRIELTDASDNKISSILRVGPGGFSHQSGPLYFLDIACATQAYGKFPHGLSEAETPMYFENSIPRALVLLLSSGDIGLYVAGSETHQKIFTPIYVLGSNGSCTLDSQDEILVRPADLLEADLHSLFRPPYRIEPR